MRLVIPGRLPDDASVTSGRPVGWVGRSGPMVDYRLRYFCHVERNAFLAVRFSDGEVSDPTLAGAAAGKSRAHLVGEKSMGQD